MFRELRRRITIAKDKKIPANLVFCKEKFTYDNIEELKQDVGLKIGNIVELNGYYTAGDGANHKRIIANEDDGSGVLLENRLYANIVHNGEVNVSWFGAKGDGVTDDTQMVHKCFNYTNGYSFDVAKSYTFQELNAIEQIIPKCSKIIIDRNYLINKRLIFYKNYKVECYNIKGAWGDKKLPSIIYQGTEFSGFTTVSFINEDNSFKFISSKEDVQKLVDNDFNNYKNLSNGLTLNVNIGVTDGNDVCLLFGGCTSEISGKIGLLGYCGSLSLLSLRGWENNYNKAHIYGAGQSCAILKSNTSQSFNDCYFTHYGRTEATKPKQTYVFKPSGVPSEWNIESELINIYQKKGGSTFYNPVIEGGNYHMCFDDNCNSSVYSPYFETHDPSQGTLACYLITNNSRVDSFGGFFAKSNTNGNCVRAYGNNTSWNSYFKTTKILSGGTLLWTINCDATYSFDNLNLGSENLFSIANNITDIDLDKVFINNIKTENIYLQADAAPNRIDFNACKDLDICFKLAEKFGAKNIIFRGDYTLNKNLILPNIPITIKLENYNLFLDKFSLILNSNKLNIETGTVVGSNTNEFLTFLKSDNAYKVNIILSGLKLKKKMLIYGTYGNVLTSSCIFLENCYFEEFENQFLAGTPSAAQTCDNYTIFINNVSSEPIFKLMNSPFATLKTNLDLVASSSIVNDLDTPYYTNLMQQEGVYNDFISYMDEKTLYDKQQRKLEQDRQLAYQEALKENPDLTYEEFMSVQPITLNLIEEPQPSEALKKFMEKYL